MLIEEKVYKMGLIAELTGKTNTITQAQTWPLMVVPFKDAIPNTRKKMRRWMPQIQV